MKKYTSKSQKVEMYSEKYGVSKEEVFRILTEHEDLLTFEELKIKYDDPNIGKLPDWLTEDDIIKMIWKSVHECWSIIFSQRMSKEELVSDLYEYIKKKIGMYTSFNHIKTAIYNRIRSLASEYTRKGKYIIGSTDETYPSKEGDNAICYKFEPKIYEETTIEDKMFIEQIRNIKAPDLKDLLILAGYLIGNITELRKDYLELLRRSDVDIQNNIKRLEQVILDNDKLEWERLDNIRNKTRKTKLKFQDVIKALKFNEDFKEDQDVDDKASIKRSIKEIKSYISMTSILDLSC